jgi:ubiquinone/menaquinone biosynthesis C-methylase UbiE
VNRVELEQAARLFEAPRFYFADVFDKGLPEAYFDVVVLAGSLQYFSDLKGLFAALKRLMKPEGVIHIIDTNFYTNAQLLANAAAGTQNYYACLGVPEMAGFYHHYLLEDIGGMNLNERLWIRFLQKIKVLSPFPWIRVGLKGTSF